MVLEGVHLVPGMVPAAIEGALVVHAVLAIPNEDVHAEHFSIRGAASEGARGQDKYLDRLADIRHIQDFIVDEAAKTGVPVVHNGNIEQAIAAVIQLVFDRAERMEGVR